MKTSFSNRFATTLQQQWQKGGVLSTLLTPLSWLTHLFVAGKNFRYKHNFSSSYRPPCPVIIVGNIYVGGTGKTPLSIALVCALQEKGFKPGVISRGYGVDIGKEPRCAYGENARAELIGDEPSLIARHAPVCVHPQRQLAIEKLLNQWPETNIIISDDGLQHLKLQRDIEIIVQDNRQTGNGKLLPAGPLREPAARLNQVDFIITNLKDSALADFKSRFSHEIAMSLEPVSATQIATGKTISVQQFKNENTHKKIVAIAGIGQPERFFSTLRQIALPLAQQLPFPDHYAYSALDFKAIDADLVLMTSKDASKCSTLSDPRLWYISVEPRFSNPRFFDLIEEKIRLLPLYSSN